MTIILKESIGAFADLANDIQQICNPLKEIGIQLFSYRKTFTNGSRINVSNNASWLHDYYELNLYQSSLFEQEINNYQTGFLLWPQTSPLPIFSHSRDYYNCDNGITYIKKKPDSCEFFIFSADKENKQIVNFYINNLELLKNFADYFLEKSSVLIKPTLKKLIQIPLSTSDKIENNNIYATSNTSNSFNNLLSTFKPNPFSMLSAREKSCIEGILAGKTAKIIARELNLSYRTIEYYISNIKKKMNCQSTYELLKIFYHD